MIHIYLSLLLSIKLKTTIHKSSTKKKQTGFDKKNIPFLALQNNIIGKKSLLFRSLLSIDAKEKNKYIKFGIILKYTDKNESKDRIIIEDNIYYYQKKY